MQLNYSSAMNPAMDTNPSGFSTMRTERLILCCYLLIVLATSGCATYRRDAFLKSNSLDRFMADRPQAASLLQEYPALEQWLHAEWNRPIGDYRVHWSDEKPVASSTAEHASLPQFRLIVIRVSKTLSPTDQVFALSYEICNAQERSGFDAVCARAAVGKVTRQDFVNEINSREYSALLRVKECFPNLLPLSSNEVASTTLYSKLLEVPDEFREYQAWSIRTHSMNYLHAQELYGQEYDLLVKKGSYP
jgi:hypothetical protein